MAVAKPADPQEDDAFPIKQLAVLGSMPPGFLDWQ
jgi:hypothetical protein